MSTVLRSQIECNKCHQIVASLHRHDFRSCKCGSVSLDGGRDYMRVLCKGDYTFRSIVIDADVTEDDARCMIEALNGLWVAGGCSPGEENNRYHLYWGEPPFIALAQLKYWLRLQRFERGAKSGALGYDARKILLRLEEEGLVTCRRSKTGKRTGWRCVKPMVGFAWYKGKFERRP